jgi:hypothetical protein
MHKDQKFTTRSALVKSAAMASALIELCDVSGGPPGHSLSAVGAIR